MNPEPRQRRLQRAPDFTGARLDRFSQVFLRHGLPGALLGVVCLTVPDMRALLQPALVPLLAEPARYLSAGLLTFAALSAWSWRLEGRVDAAAIGWIVYLLALSAWEEWVFRAALPYFAESHGASLRSAVLVTNAAFGALHYFTLRWKWHWCVGAFLGGLGLSRLLHHDFDLALVVGVHWMATFLNTPRPPGRRNVRRRACPAAAPNPPAPDRRRPR